VVEEYCFAYNALLDRSRRGAYDFDAASNNALPLGGILARPGGRQWWADRVALFPQDFVDEVEGQFPDIALPAA
jgi:hypothetical protein